MIFFIPFFYDHSVSVEQDGAKAAELAAYLPALLKDLFRGVVVCINDEAAHGVGVKCSGDLHFVVFLNKRQYDLHYGSFLNAFIIIIRRHKQRLAAVILHKVSKSSSANSQQKFL